MASCPKCGRLKVRKDKLKQKFCRLCGVLPNEKGLDRNGKPTTEEHNGK